MLVKWLLNSHQPLISCKGYAKPQKYESKSRAQREREKPKHREPGGQRGMILDSRQSEEHVRVTRIQAADSNICSNDELMTSSSRLVSINIPSTQKP